MATIFARRPDLPPLNDGALRASRLGCAREAVASLARGRVRRTARTPRCRPRVSRPTATCTAALVRRRRRTAAAYDAISPTPTPSLAPAASASASAAAADSAAAAASTASVRCSVPMGTACATGVTGLLTRTNRTPQPGNQPRCGRLLGTGRHDRQPWARRQSRTLTWGRLLGTCADPPRARNRRSAANSFRLDPPPATECTTVRAQVHPPPGGGSWEPETAAAGVARCTGPRPDSPPRLTCQTVRAQVSPLMWGRLLGAVG